MAVSRFWILEFSQEAYPDGQKTLDTMERMFGLNGYPVRTVRQKEVLAMVTPCIEQAKNGASGVSTSYLLLARAGDQLACREVVQRLPATPSELLVLDGDLIQPVEAVLLSYAIAIGYAAQEPPFVWPPPPAKGHQRIFARGTLVPYKPHEEDINERMAYKDRMAADVDGLPTNPGSQNHKRCENPDPDDPDSTWHCHPCSFHLRLRCTNENACLFCHHPAHKRSRGGKKQRRAKGAGSEPSTADGLSSYTSSDPSAR